MVIEGPLPAHDSDQILTNTFHFDCITVTIEGLGTKTFDVSLQGERLRTLASTAACILSQKATFSSGRRHNPWLLVRYDKRENVLVVRAKNS